MNYANSTQAIEAITKYRTKTQRLMQDRDFFEISNEAMRLVTILGEQKTSAKELEEKSTSSNIAKLVLNLRDICEGWSVGDFDKIRAGYNASISLYDEVIEELSKLHKKPEKYSGLDFSPSLN